MLTGFAVGFGARPVLLAMLAASLSHGGESLILRDNFVFVEARINNQGPFRLMVDTGSEACLLTPEAAKRSGLIFDHRAILTTLAGEELIPGSSANSIQVGADIENDVEILVLPLEHVRKLDSKADGVLGQGFLKRGAYLIDYKRKRLLTHNEAIEEAIRLPISISAGEFHGRPVVPVQFDAAREPWLLTLDSGASNIVVECTSRCPMAHDVEPRQRILTFTGDRTASRALLHHIVIGGLTLFSTEAVLVDANPDQRSDGVLPTRLFSAVYVDHNTVRLAH